MLGKLRVKRSPEVEELALQCLRKLQSQLSNFKNENKIFKAKFLFDQIDYYQWTQDLDDQLASGEFYIQERLKDAAEKQRAEIQKERERLQKEERERYEERRRIEEERRRLAQVEVEQQTSEKDLVVVDTQTPRMQHSEIQVQSLNQPKPMIRPPVNEVQIQTSPKQKVEGDPVKKTFTFSKHQQNASIATSLGVRQSNHTNGLDSRMMQSNEVRQSLKREESKTTLAMQNHSPPGHNHSQYETMIQYNNEQEEEVKKDRISMLRAQNVQIAAQISGRDHYKMPTEPTPPLNDTVTRSQYNLTDNQIFTVSPKPTENKHTNQQILRQSNQGGYQRSDDPLLDGGLKIYEQQRPYYMEDLADSSSRQQTQIISNYHDDRIYETQKKRLHPYDLASVGSARISQIVTPKVVVGEQERKQYYFQQNTSHSPAGIPQNDLNKSHYSVKTVQVSKPGAMHTFNDHDTQQTVPQVMNHHAMGSLSNSLQGGIIGGGTLQSEKAMNATQNSQHNSRYSAQEYNQIYESKERLITIHEQDDQPKEQLK